MVSKYSGPLQSLASCARQRPVLASLNMLLRMHILFRPGPCQVLRMGSSEATPFGSSLCVRGNAVLHPLHIQLGLSGGMLGKASQLPR